MSQPLEPDFGRTWLYRASVRGQVIAEERHGSDVTACQWALQVVWPNLTPRPADAAGMVVERQDGGGEWVFVERMTRMREA